MYREKLHKIFRYENCFIYCMVTSIIVFGMSIYISEGDSLINILFLNQNDWFMDFFNSIQYGKYPYEAGVIYPPLINVIYAFCGHLIPEEIKNQGTIAIRNSNIGMMVFMIVNIVQVFVFVKIVGFYYRNKSFKIKYDFLAILLLLSHPVIFCIQRGNSVILAVEALLVFVIFKDSEIKILRHLAFAMLAISASIKIYPAIFGLLLIRERRWKDSFICLGYGILIFFRPFCYLNGGISSFEKMITNIIHCSNNFSLNRLGTKYNLSNFIDVVNYAFNINLDGVKVWLLLLILALSVVLVSFGKSLEEWKVLAILSLDIILIPSFSYTYNLMFLIIPVLSFLKYTSGKIKIIDYIYTFLFVIVFMPFIQSSNDILGMIREDDYYPFTLDCLVKNIAIIMMFIFINIEYVFAKMFRCKKINY